MTTDPTPADPCPNCQHPQHLPGAECETRIHHGRNFHACLCLARPGAALACPPQMTCQGGTLGYSDIWYLQQGHSLSSAGGVISPEVLKGPASVGFPSREDDPASPAPVSPPPATDRAGLRDRVAAAIWERQNPGRRYADCEYRWRADAEADADAVLSALPPDGRPGWGDAADVIEAEQARKESEERAQFGSLDHETELQGEAVRASAALLRRLAAGERDEQQAQQDGPETRGPWGTVPGCTCPHPADEHSIYGCADGCGCEWMPKRPPMDPVHILGIEAPSCDAEFEGGGHCAKPAGHRPPGSDDPHVPAAPVAGQPPAGAGEEPFAGDARRCIACSDNMSSHIRDGDGVRCAFCGCSDPVAAEAQPRLVRVCTPCPECDHTLDENGACANGCRTKEA